MEKEKMHDAETLATMTVYNLRKLLEDTLETHVNNTFKTYSTEDVEKLLGVSKKTLSVYRTNGSIGYSQIDAKIWYAERDLEHFLKSHHVKPGRR